MSVNGGPSTFLARSKVGRFCKYRPPAGPTKSQSVLATHKDDGSAASRLTVLDGASNKFNGAMSSDSKAKPKKRRKNLDGLVIKKRVAELCRLRRPDVELLKLKLKDVRVPIVLLNRINRDPFKPKLANKSKSAKKKSIEENDDSTEPPVEASNEKIEKESLAPVEEGTKKQNDEKKTATVAEAGREKVKSRREAKSNEPIVEKKEARLERSVKSKQAEEAKVEIKDQKKKLEVSSKSKDANEAQTEIAVEQKKLEKTKEHGVESKTRKEAKTKANKDSSNDPTPEAEADKLAPQPSVDKRDSRFEKSKEHRVESKTKPIETLAPKESQPEKSKTRKEAKTKVNREPVDDPTSETKIDKTTTQPSADKRDSRLEKAKEHKIESKTKPIEAVAPKESQPEKSKTRKEAKTKANKEPVDHPTSEAKVDKSTPQPSTDKRDSRLEKSKEHRIESKTKPAEAVAPKESLPVLKSKAKKEAKTKASKEPVDDSTTTTLAETFKEEAKAEEHKEEKVAVGQQDEAKEKEEKLPSKKTEQAKPVCFLASSKIDKKILLDVVVKVDKEQTEQLIEELHCRIPQQSASGSAVESDDSNKCTKKPVQVGASSGRVKATRTTVTVVNKVTTVSRLSEDESKSTPPEPKSVVRNGEVADSDGSRSEVDATRHATSNRRLRRVSVDRINDKNDAAGPTENKPKCVEAVAEKKLVVSDNAESQPRPKKSLASRSDVDCLAESDKSLRSRTESQRKPEADKSNNAVVPENDHVQSAGISVVEETSSCKGATKRTSVARAESSRGKVLAKADDKVAEKSIKDIGLVNIVENSVESSEISKVVDKDADNQTEQTINNRRCTRNASDKSRKLVQVQSEPKSITSSSSSPPPSSDDSGSANQSQIVHKDSLNVCDDKVSKRVSKKTVQLPAAVEVEKVENENASTVKIDEKSAAAESHAKSIIDKTAQKAASSSLQVATVECKRSLRNNAAKLNSEKVQDTTSSSVSDRADDSVVKDQCPVEIKEVKKNIVGCLSRRRSSACSETLPVEIAAEEKRDEESKGQADIVDRRRSSRRKSESDSKSNKVPVKPTNSSIKESFKEKIEITKRVRRKSMSDKTDVQPAVAARSSSAEDCSRDKPRKLRSIEDQLKRPIVLGKPKRKVTFQSTEKLDEPSLPDGDSTKSPKKVKLSVSEVSNEHRQKTESKVATRTSLLKKSDTAESAPVESTKEPERPNGSLIAKKAEVVEAKVEHETQSQQQQQQQQVVKECSKSQSENNKKVTRKSSSDKHERLAEENEAEDEIQEAKVAPYVKRVYRKRFRNENGEGHSYQTRHSTDSGNKEKRNEVLAEEQNHHHVPKSRASKKSADSKIANNLDSTDDDEVVLSERVDNKENAKSLLDSQTRSTRSGQLKRDRTPKNNLLENQAPASMDCLLKPPVDPRLDELSAEDADKNVLSTSVSSIEEFSPEKVVASAQNAIDVDLAIVRQLDFDLEIPATQVMTEQCLADELEKASTEAEEGEAEAEQEEDTNASTEIESECDPEPVLGSIDVAECLENLEDEIKAYVIVKPGVEASLTDDESLAVAPAPPAIDEAVLVPKEPAAPEPVSRELNAKESLKSFLRNKRITRHSLKNGSEADATTASPSKESEAIARSLTDTIVNDSVSTIANLELKDPIDEARQHRRRVALCELKKKCTENLENKMKNLENNGSTDRSDPPSSENEADTEEEEADADAESLVDSDENLAARLARLNGLEIPPMDNLDSGVQSPSDDLQQRVVDKIVLRCPSGTSSFIGLSEELQCKYCEDTFVSHRDLKRHTREQHRQQRLVIKITKTTSNERVTHVVEPMASSEEKDSTTNDDDDDEEDDDDDDDEEEEDELSRRGVCFNGAKVTSGEQKQQQQSHTEKQQHPLQQRLDDRVEDGEIKIIVKKQSDPRNSHVVKEIKITPRTPSDSGNSSCRLPSCSPAKSDLSGGSGSCRLPAYSPAKSDAAATAPPKKRGRPRKYPIFTESELYAKQLAAVETSAPVNNGQVFTPFDSESIVVKSDVLFDNLQNVVLRDQEAKTQVEPRQPAIAVVVAEEDEPKTGEKRKRSRTLSQSSQGGVLEEQQQQQQLEGAEEVVDQDAASEEEPLVKYDIKKELVVKLTKIDTVPTDNADSDAHVVSSCEAGEARNQPELQPTAVTASETPQSQPNNQSSEKPRRGPRVVSIEDLGTGQQIDILKAGAIRRIGSALVRPPLPAPPSPASAVPEPIEPSCGNATPSHHDTSAVSEETASKILESIAEVCGDNDDSLMDDNFEPVTEPLCELQPPEPPQPRRNAIPAALIRDNALAVSSITSAEPIPKPQAFNEPSIRSPTSMQVVPHVPQPQPQQQQVQMLPPQQQFCILFIPDALYNSDTPMSKDMAPTATLVNFQPVPDAEIANKPLIFTPTTPTKLINATHHQPHQQQHHHGNNQHPHLAASTPSTPGSSASDDPSRSFTCATCSQVQDLIGRLEASLGMTEEDKSPIKCPYCSNHFQSLFYLEYHLKQEHLKCENEKQCRHGSSLRIPSQETASEYEVYITFALKCRSCYDIFSGVMPLNDHVMHKHKTLVRFKPPSSSHVPATVATVSSSAAVAAAVYPAFARRNGGRPALLQSACPSDCVCRIGIRSTDSPLQRQEMIRRCPSAMRRLEKIEPAAYEVYTCTLCNSTYLMKDEVVDHLMKMHEVSCKFPCYTCLTSFRTLQLQENHRCSETTFQDLDKLLNIAILPTIGGTADVTKGRVGNGNLSSSSSGGGGGKYPTEDSQSSTDEYSSSGGSQRQQSESNANQQPQQQQQQQQQQPPNGFKRKTSETIEAIHALLKENEAKRARLEPLPPKIRGQKPKRKKLCPKCGKRFAYRKSLLHHMIHAHIMLESGDPKETAAELLDLFKHPKNNPYADQELKEVLKHHVSRPNTFNGTREPLPIVKRRGRPPRKHVYGLNGAVTTAIAMDMRRRGRVPLERCKGCNNVIRPVKRDDEETQRRSSTDEPSTLSGLCETCRQSELKKFQQPTGKRPRGRPPLNPNHPNYRPPLPSVIKAAEREAEPIRFTCRKCPASFATLPELKDHKFTAHPRQQELMTCEMCSKTFMSRVLLEKHILLHNFFGRISDGNESSVVMRVGDINGEREEAEKENEQLRREEKQQEEQHQQPQHQQIQQLQQQQCASNGNAISANSSMRRDSSDCSCSGESKEPDRPLLHCSFCQEVFASNVSLKNHLKRDHGRRASICQFCNGLLIDTSEVRHMLDYHIVPSKTNRKPPDDEALIPGQGDDSTLREDVEELVRVLGRHRLQSLMQYHDFEGKCNNAIMRCPICPELFATRESCRHHYIWIHDDNCLLCDETFRSGSVACQHKVRDHTSTASYLWCIQRLVTAIVNTLRLDPGQPSHVLFQILAARLGEEQQQQQHTQQHHNLLHNSHHQQQPQHQELQQHQQQHEAAHHHHQAVASTTSQVEQHQQLNSTHVDAAAADTASFLEEQLVLSEDQLPDAGNMIEVVIGREDSEDDLLSLLNLSPSYESGCDQQRKLTRYTGDVTPDDEEGNEELERPPEALLDPDHLNSTPAISVPQTPVPTAISTTITTTLESASVEEASSANLAPTALQPPATPPPASPAPQQPASSSAPATPTASQDATSAIVVNSVVPATPPPPPPPSTAQPSVATGSPATVPSSPVVEANYEVSSSACRLDHNNDIVLVITHEDYVTYRNDIPSLALKIKATCNTLTLEQITGMLTTYFESVSSDGAT